MRPEIVCELSGNAGGSLDNCLQLIDEAKKLGVDRIKFQRFDPDRLAKRRAGTFWEGETRPESYLAKLYHDTETPIRWWPSIMNELGGHAWACSVFSVEDLEAMLMIDCPMIKIASYEMYDLPLIHAAVRARKPLVISIHPLAGRDDLNRTMNAAAGARALTLLSATPYEDVSYAKASERLDWLLREAHPKIEIGLSDHSQADDCMLAIYAANCNVAMLERHLCLPDIHTPDSGFSSTPEQFGRYIKFIRDGAKREASETQAG